jgi:hypothetical protein
MEPIAESSKAVTVVLKKFLGLIKKMDDCSSEVLRASVLVKSGLENRDYGRRGSAALTMRHPSVGKRWH